MNDPDDQSKAGGRDAGHDDPGATANDVPARAHPDDEDWDEAPAPRRRRPTRPPGRPGGSGQSWDDGDDEWDEDDDWSPDRGGGGRRDRTLVVGIAAVILIVVLVVVLSKKNNTPAPVTNAGGTAPNGQAVTTAPKGGLCPNLPPALGGQARTSEKGGPGVYIWNDFQNLHVRAKGGLVTIKITGSAPIKVKDKPADDNERKAYGASFTKWDEMKAKGGSAQINGNVVTITIPASPTPVGPNLDVSCEVKNLKFEVNGPSGALALKDIHVGDSGQASANPYSIDREAG